MMKRIFVAIDISEAARVQTSAYIESLRRAYADLRVGWERAEKLHLTLKFLGETNERQLGNLQTIVQEAASKIGKFPIRIAETGVFPNARRGRVLWIDVKDDEGNLAALNRLIETGCEQIGFARERRSFKPHLTIARLKEPARSGDLIKTHLETKFEPVGFDVSEIVIYESSLKPTGSIYQKVSIFELR